MKLKKKIKTEFNPIILEQEKEIIITQEYIENVLQKIESSSHLNSIKLFLKVFRYIVNEDLENKEGLQENDQLKVKSFLQIKDSNVYTKVMTFAFQSFPNILNDIIEKQKKHRKTEIIFKVFVTNFFKFMNATTEDRIKILCLKSLNMFIDQITPFKNILKKYQKFLIEEWSCADSIQIKLYAFLVLQKIGQKLSQEDLETFLRKVYLSYVKQTKQTNVRNHQLIQFMINCFKELLTINTQISYFIGFSFLRQIAIHLKMGFREKSQENIFMIYNWQYLNTIKLWSVCVQIPGLEELAYPLIQIVTGILDLYYTEQYFPFYLHLLQVLISISNSSDISINIWKFLIKMMNGQNFRQKRKTVTARKYDFQLNIKIQNKFLKVNDFWNDLFQEIIDVLIFSLGSQSQKIYFPEISVYIIKELKNLKKIHIINSYKQKIQSLIKLIEQRSELIRNLRIDQNPKNCKENIGGENEIYKQSKKIEENKNKNMKQKIENQDEDIFSEQEELPQKKEVKKKQKKQQKKIVQDKESSEPSEFVEEELDGQAFGNDEELSDLEEESLSGDPDQSLDEEEEFEDDE